MQSVLRSVHFPLLAAVLSLGSAPLLALPIYVDQDASYQYINATAATTQAVPADWFAYDFDDSGWFTGTAPFSSNGAATFGADLANVDDPYTGAAPPLPGTFTQWDVPFDPLARTEFMLAAPTALTIWIAVDNGIGLSGSPGMYLNGVAATASVNAEGAAFRWEHVFDIPASHTFAGRNVFAFQLEDHGGATAFTMVVSADDSATNPIFSDNPAPEPPDDVQSVPEPATVALMVLGIAGLMRGGRRRSA